MKREALWIWFTLFAVYVLSFSGRFHVMDELALFTAGFNLADHGRADINQLIWTNHWTPHPPGIWGVDGNLYTKKAPGLSLLVALFAWIAQWHAQINPVVLGLLSGAVITASTASLLLIWLCDLGFSRRTALLTSLGYGLCTIAWIYARMVWGLTLVGLLLLAAVWALWRVAGGRWQEVGGRGQVAGGSSRVPSGRGRPSPVVGRPSSVVEHSTHHVPRTTRWLFLAGTCSALAVATRYETVVSVGLLGIVLLFVRNGWPASLRQRMVAFALPLLVVGGLLVAYNVGRFGSLGETGYTQEAAFTLSWLSLYGLTFSPGQGIFTHSPFLLIGFWGIGAVWRKLPPPYVLLIGALCVLNWIFYASWFAWGGIWNWGPRFLLPVLPLAMLFVAGALERFGGRRWFWGMAATLALLSVVFNGMGMATNFNQYFARLAANRAFILDWRLFPPLGNWRIFGAGAPIDIFWLARNGGSIHVDWWGMLPALLLLLLSTTMLAWRTRGRQRRASFLVTMMAGIALAVWAVANLAWMEAAGAPDQPLFQALREQARAGDRLLVSLPPYADAQELTLALMARQPHPLPTYTWIDGNARGIRPQERARLHATVRAESDRVWLFERWHDPSAPESPTASWLARSGFPLAQAGWDEVGRLSLYQFVADAALATIPVAEPFERKIQLDSFALPVDAPEAGSPLFLRLTWQADNVATLPGVTAFAHLLVADDPEQRVAQQDRLLSESVPNPLPAGGAVTIRQNLTLAPPVTLAPGEYMIVVGLYDADGEPLRRTENGDPFLYLTTLRLE